MHWLNILQNQRCSKFNKKFVKKKILKFSSQKLIQKHLSKKFIEKIRRKNLLKKFDEIHRKDTKRNRHVQKETKKLQGVLALCDFWGLEKSRISQILH